MDSNRRISYLACVGDLSNTVAQIFSRAGPLSSMPGFEFRPQQRSMAMAVAEALVQRDHLIIEAPTGVGKSLAYLIPSLLYALETGRKAIVSTHTKNLQDQLFLKDLALVRAVHDMEFSAVVLKGRRNFLCTTRLRNALAAPASLFDEAEAAELQRVAAWAATTRDGDIEGMGFAPSPHLWDMLCSEQGICTRTGCGVDCFFQRAKEGARAATLVIMNHALFFTLLGHQGTDERYIFDNDFVVFDEAHTLEAAAGANIGGRISRYQVLSAVHRLYNPKTRKGVLGSRRKGIRTLVEGIEKDVTAFFDAARADALAASRETSGAYAHAAREIRVRSPRVTPDTISPSLLNLCSRARDAEDALGDAAVKQEVAAARRVVAEAQALIAGFLAQSVPGYAYWIEVGRSPAENIAFCSAPPDVGESIAPALLRDDTSAIMTGATLSVDNRLDYFQRRIGATTVRTMILCSPFDHARQMRLCVVRDLPEPDSRAYAEELPRWIMQSIDRTDGHALVLFTSRTLMSAVAESLGAEFRQRNITLLLQGSGLQRHLLLEQFKSDARSVLFGLDSFWMGIDVPGEALQHVIITRLPFSVPNHPLIEARLEAIAERGGNPFAEYTLPEAVLKFRQGAGRLIRSTTDTGIVTVLDSRILRRSYGTVFVNSLPACPVDLCHADGEVEPLPVAE